MISISEVLGPWRRAGLAMVMAGLLGGAEGGMAADLGKEAGTSGATAGATTGGADRDRNRVAIEALRRLQGMDLEANPAVKSAVLRVLESVRGTAAFVELVRGFKLEGQEAGLLEVASNPAEVEGGMEAMRWLLARGQGERVIGALAKAEGERRRAWVLALSRTGDSQAVPLLKACLEMPGWTAQERTPAIQGLAGTEEGARVLLELAEANRLDEAARTTAGLALAQARWPAIRDVARKVLPLPSSGDGKPLPPIAELARLRGNPERGAAVFRSEAAGCIKCHRVGGEGVDFGPALTEIGTKLGKHAMWESILDPSAGIAFGFEGWSVETRDGEELFGILASETPAELGIKQQTGVITRVSVSEVVSRRKQALSMMPAGLAQVVSREDLVDLVEYLGTLKAREGNGGERERE